MKTGSRVALMIKSEMMSVDFRDTHIGPAWTVTKFNVEEYGKFVSEFPQSPP